MSPISTPPRELNGARKRPNGNEIAMEYERELFWLKIATVICFAIAGCAALYACTVN